MSEVRGRERGTETETEADFLPRFGSMRRKMAKVVEGCWYNLLNVVPGSCSRYSERELALFDMVGEVVVPSGGRPRREFHVRFSLALSLSRSLSLSLSQHRLSAAGWDRPPDGAERIDHLVAGARCIEWQGESWLVMNECVGGTAILCTDYLGMLL